MSAVTHIERVLMGHCISLPAYILSDLAQIVDAARREGAEQMREAIAHQAEINALYGVHGTTVSATRAMPLPTGQRQAVRLADRRLREIAYEAGCFGEEFDITGAQTDKLCRAIETAVLAANGLETK